jgi:hypothetical protein
MRKLFLLTFGIALIAMTGNLNAQVIIEALDIHASGVFGHNANLGGSPTTGVTINGAAIDPSVAVPADPLDITLTYGQLDLDADGTANDSVTFTVNVTGGTNAGGDPFQRAFNQGIDTGFGNINTLTVAVINVTGTTTDSGSPIFFDGFTGAGAGAGTGAGNDLDRRVEINGEVVEISSPDTGAFQFVTMTVDFAEPTPTVLFDNSGGVAGAGEPGVGSIVARNYDLQFSLTEPGGGDTLKGDVDLSGEVDFLDISPFIDALAVGGTQPEADCNCDGAVDFLDINPFIGILAGP